jgi:DNA-binding NarL/FixJ family response regulator
MDHPLCTHTIKQLEQSLAKLQNEIADVQKRRDNSNRALMAADLGEEKIRLSALDFKLSMGDATIDDIGKAVKSVLDGHEWISPVLGKALTQSKSISDKLSAQEKKAIILYASGLKLEVVARRMDVAPSTVKQYIDRAKEKFRASGVPVSTKTELYKILRDLELVD